MTREEVMAILLESPLFSLLTPNDVERIIETVLLSNETTNPFDGTVTPELD